MIHFIRYLQKRKDTTLVIISDANTFYIDTILNVYNLRVGFEKIITNLGIFASPERLLIQTNPELKHSCVKCPKNLCKSIFFSKTCHRSRNSLISQGTEVRKILQERDYQTVWYIGDGRNDVCPCLDLSR